MKLVDLANLIYQELGEPSNLSIPPVVTWLRGNIGRLNTLLGTEYTIDATSQEISPELGYAEADIFKETYNIKYYERMVASNLGAAAAQSLSAIQDGESSVKWASKSEIAKYWNSMKKDAQDNLNSLVTAYTINMNEPLQITGDDNVDTPQDYSDNYYRSYNNRLDY